MKKLLLAAIAAGLLSTNAMAWWMNGAEITAITANQTGVMIAANAYSNNYQYTLNPNNNTKEMLALAMTAQSQGTAVNLEVNGQFIDSVVTVTTQP